MDPRVIQRSLLRDAPPPPPFVAPEPAPTPPPPTAKDARRHLAKAVADHQDALAQLDRLTAAQSRARTACVDASSAVVSAEAMLEEAQQNEPKSYISRLLSNGDAAPPVDLVETAQRKLADAERSLDLARRGEAALTEGIVKAENAVSYARMRLDSALQEALATAPEVAALLAKWDEAVAQLGDVHCALSAVAAKTGSPELKRWRDVFGGLVNGDGTLVRLPFRDGPLATRWRAALQALDTDAAAALPDG